MYRAIRVATGVLILMGVIACAGKKWEFTAGPLRAEFIKKFHIVTMDASPVWVGEVLLAGEMDRDTIYYVESYIGPHMAGKYLGPIPFRTLPFKAIFTLSQYCEAVGQPLDRFDPAQEFWRRGQSPDPPSVDPNVAPQADGTVPVVIKFFSTKPDVNNTLSIDRHLSDAKAEVKLECASCRCGPGMGI